MAQVNDMEYESKSEGMVGNGDYIPIESVTDKKVIKNGFLTFKVDSTDTAKDEISRIVTENEGGGFF